MPVKKPLYSLQVTFLGGHTVPFHFWEKDKAEKVLQQFKAAHEALSESPEPGFAFAIEIEHLSGVAQIQPASCMYVNLMEIETHENFRLDMEIFNEEWRRRLKERLNELEGPIGFASGTNGKP